MKIKNEIQFTNLQKKKKKKKKKKEERDSVKPKKYKSINIAYISKVSIKNLHKMMNDFKSNKLICLSRYANNKVQTCISRF